MEFWTAKQKLGDKFFFSFCCPEGRSSSVFPIIPVCLMRLCVRYIVISWETRQVPGALSFDRGNSIYLDPGTVRNRFIRSFARSAHSNQHVQDPFAHWIPYRASTNPRSATTTKLKLAFACTVGLTLSCIRWISMLAYQWYNRCNFVYVSSRIYHKLQENQKQRHRLERRIVYCIFSHVSKCNRKKESKQIMTIVVAVIEFFHFFYWLEF